MRDYVQEEELEARPFLSAAQVRRAVSRYRRAEHPPTSRMSREAASQYMDRFKAPVQDNGDQDTRMRLVTKDARANAGAAVAAAVAISTARSGAAAARRRAGYRGCYSTNLSGS